MLTEFGRFAESPIGTGLAVADGGLTLSGADSTLDAKARSGIALDGGIAGVEFMVWGDADLAAAIGVCTSAADLDAEVGAAAGAGWRLHTGQVLVGGTVVATGLPVISKGESVGVRVELDGSRRLAFYRGGAKVFDSALPLEGPVHFAVSLASAAPGGLAAVVNAGQWQGVSDAVAAGWTLPTASIAPIRVSTEHYMSAPGDSPANTPWSGIVAGDGLDTVASVSFWPWDSTSRTGAGSLKLLDAEGLLDAAALGDVRDVPVAIRRVAQGEPLSASQPVARYVLERIVIDDDGRKTAVLRDPHDDLDLPLHRAVLLPSINEKVAWQPQPVVIGVVRSAPGIIVNSDGSVLWLSDAPLASVGQVLDRGAPIASGSGYSLVSDGQQLAMTSPPLGPVISDVSTRPDVAPASLELLLRDMFRRIGKSAWSSDDAAAIDTATGYAGGGYYSGTGATAREALAEVLPSYCADYWSDADGVLRLARLIAPETVPDEDLAFDLSWSALSGALVVTPDLAPNLSRRMSYQPNAAPLSAGDQVTDLELLPPATRQQLSGVARGQVYAAGPLASRYVRAEAAAPLLSRFDRRADAQAEIDRVVALYAVPRNFYDIRLTARPDLQFRPGQVGRITYPRYGLQAGRKVIVASAVSNPVTGRHTVRLWGA